jgi:hypothetical protein
VTSPSKISPWVARVPAIPSVFNKLDGINISYMQMHDYTSGFLQMEMSVPQLTSFYQQSSSFSELNVSNCVITTAQSSSNVTFHCYNNLFCLKLLLSLFQLLLLLLLPIPRAGPLASGQRAGLPIIPWYSHCHQSTPLGLL